MKASIVKKSSAVIQGVQVKARLYRMLPVLALLAVVVEGSGAGEVVLGMKALIRRGPTGEARP